MNKMKYLLPLVFIYFTNQSYAVTVDDILHKHGKDRVVSMLNQQFQSQENSKLTININGAFRQMHRPAQEYITSETIKIDLKRLEINANKFNELIINDLEQRNREKLRKVEETKNLRLKKIEETKKIRMFGFKLDGWKPGTSIFEMKQQARKKQLTMSPGQSTYLSKYNEQLLNSQPVQRNYTYRTNLLGKITTITLSFTKDTKKLFQVKATFHVSQLKPEERKYFYESLYTQLTDKYGKAKNISRNDVKENSRKSLLGFLTSNISENIIGSLQEWDINETNKATLSYKKNYHTMNSYELIYKNIPLSIVNKKEITNNIKKRTNQGLSVDSERL